MPYKAIEGSAEIPEPRAEERATHDYENWHDLPLHEFECIDGVGDDDHFAVL